jgi:hypothetical protein
VNFRESSERLLRPKATMRKKVVAYINTLCYIYPST